MAQLLELRDPTENSTKLWPETHDFAEMEETIVKKLWTTEKGKPAVKRRKELSMTRSQSMQRVSRGAMIS